METLNDRQQTLLEMLQERNSVSIEEIEQAFSISTPTAYRDVHALVQAGVAVKTNGGVKLQTSSEGKCSFCGGTINERTTFIFHLQDGSQKKACCPHCGLMGLGQSNVVSALASDFLYGRMINARQAAFLLESSVTMCCEPSVLCFGSEIEAKNFQAGFGGKLYSLEDATKRVNELMKIQT